MCVSHSEITIEASFARRVAACSAQYNAIYLDTAERRVIAANTTLSQVVCCHDVARFSASSQTEAEAYTESYSLRNFSHPTKDLLVLVKPAAGAANMNCLTDTGFSSAGPVVRIALNLNGHVHMQLDGLTSRQLIKAALYGNPVSASTEDEAFIYFMPFSLALGDDNETDGSSINFSRIDHPELQLTFVGGCSYEVTVLQRNFNMLRYHHGYAALAFA